MIVRCLQYFQYRRQRALGGLLGATLLFVIAAACMSGLSYATDPGATLCCAALMLLALLCQLLMLLLLMKKTMNEKWH